MLIYSKTCPESSQDGFDAKLLLDKDPRGHRLAGTRPSSRTGAPSPRIAFPRIPSKPRQAPIKHISILHSANKRALFQNTSGLGAENFTSFLPPKSAQYHILSLESKAPPPPTERVQTDGYMRKLKALGGPPHPGRSMAAMTAMAIRRICALGPDGPPARHRELPRLAQKPRSFHNFNYKRPILYDHLPKIRDPLSGDHQPR